MKEFTSWRANKKQKEYTGSSTWIFETSMFAPRGSFSSKAAFPNLPQTEDQVFKYLKLMGDNSVKSSQN